MKTYRIKKVCANSLSGLDGLFMTPTECRQYVNINVFDYQTTHYLNTCSRLTCLPKNCDNQLVHTLLEQMQCDKTTHEQVERLREYLSLAKQKDKNDAINSDLKQSLKQIFLGFLVIVLSGITCVGLVFLTAILSPASASWMALLMLLAVGTAAWGLLKLSIGCFKLGIEIFSICFRRKNTEQLPLLESELRSYYFQSLLPPSYYEVMKNNKEFPSAPDLHTDPPTYDETMKNRISSSTGEITVPMCVPAQVSLIQCPASYFHNSRRGNSSRSLDNYPATMNHQFR